MDMEAITRAFTANALADHEAYAGQVLREADLDAVAHYFVYHADSYADVYLEEGLIG